MTLVWSSDNREVDTTRPPVMWWVDDTEARRVFGVLWQEYLEDRERGIRIGIVLVNKVADHWWQDAAIMATGRYTANNGMDYAPLTLEYR